MMKSSSNRIAVLLITTWVLLLPASWVARGQQTNITMISTIQGSTDESPLVGQTVTIEAVVVGDFQTGDSDASRNLGGFFCQEEDEDADSDPSTSEGIFVQDVTDGVDVERGNLVQVTGTVEEQFGQTRIMATMIEIIDTAVPLPSPAVITFPLEDATSLEAFEGMSVGVSNTMLIVEMFNLDRFNEIGLFNAERPYQYTQLNTPDAAGFENYTDNYLDLNRITYDDGLGVQNANIQLLDGFSDYSTSTAWRMGDSIENAQGILHFDFSRWRIRSVEDGSNVFARTNPRPTTPPAVNGNITMTSFNVLNFFTTLDDSDEAATGPNGLEPRGADSMEEFERQLDKLVTVFTLLDLDIVALVELENDFGNPDDTNSTTALGTLVAAINTALGSPVYEAVYPGSRYVDSSDVISVGFFYKPSTVTLKGTPQILNDDVLMDLDATLTLPVFDGPSTNRAALAVSFESNGECITIANNHFKSKGGSGEGLDADQGDGAANFNNRRLQAAMAVSQWLETDPTGAECAFHSIVGDLNAYAMEDPIQYLVQQAGYVSVEPPTAFSYVFDGQVGTLDYILMKSPKDSNPVVDAAVWHISEDEADALDYNLDFGRSAEYFDASNPARPSDHSPVLVGLDLSVAPMEGETGEPDVVEPVDEAPPETPESNAGRSWMALSVALGVVAFVPFWGM